MPTMLMFLVVCVLTACVFAVETVSQKVSYKGSKVLRVAVDDDNVDIMKRLIGDLGLDAWQDARTVGRFADIVVSPEHYEAVTRSLDGIHLQANRTESAWDVMHDDLQAAIKAEANYDVYEPGTVNIAWFRSFHPYSDHIRFLHDLHHLVPDNSEIVSSGISLHGRNITGIRIFGGNIAQKRPAVVFHGTVHAREWIATMVVEYLAYQLLTNASASHIIGQYDIYAFPVVNPDGFVYTQTTDRLWRKNRQDTSNSTCVGRDINRNWPIAWSTEGGASSDPCAQDYRGGAQADAPETAALTLWLHQVQKDQKIQLYIDYHSYGQLFMTPYGYTCEILPSNNAELQRLAEGVADAIYGVHGVYYQSGGICSMLYRSTGNSVDYVHDTVGAAYAFTSELRDMGQTGFVLPPAQIEPSCEEAYAGIEYLLNNMKPV